MKLSQQSLSIIESAIKRQSLNMYVAVNKQS